MPSLSDICPACGGSIGGELSVSELMFGTGEKFCFAICAECGTHWLDDVPSDLSPYYPDDYYSVATDPDMVFASPVVQ